ncbi:MAG: ribonuclease P protein component [Phycisphaerales bacterium]
MRLTHDREFARVFRQGISRAAGPLVVYGLPNELAYPRLGLSVSRRVGNAVARNRIKRRLRECFRLSQYDHIAHQLSLDIVIVVKPHEAKEATQEQYCAALRHAIDRIHIAWLGASDG